MREQNDELNGQILSLSLFEAKNLFATQTKAQSLATEIDNASKDQVRSPVAVLTLNKYITLVTSYALGSNRCEKKSLLGV